MPLSRRQILRRRRVTVFGGLTALLGTTIYLPLTLLAPLSPAPAQVAAYETPVQEAISLSFPDFGAAAVGAVGFGEGCVAHQIPTSRRCSVRRQSSVA